MSHHRNHCLFLVWFQARASARPRARAVVRRREVVARARLARAWRGPLLVPAVAVAREAESPGTWLRRPTRDSLARALARTLVRRLEVVAAQARAAAELLVPPWRRPTMGWCAPPGQPLVSHHRARDSLALARALVWRWELLVREVQVAE